MKRPTVGADSAWRLRVELLSTNALLWVVRAGQKGTLNPEVHRYLYDRYWRLAQLYQRSGKEGKAAKFYSRAKEHFRFSGHDGPPFAAALAMPVPRPPLSTWAVSPGRHDPDDAA